MSLCGHTFGCDDPLQTCGLNCNHTILACVMNTFVSAPLQWVMFSATRNRDTML
jgi:hypothetical protein